MFGVWWLAVGDWELVVGIVCTGETVVIGLPTVGGWCLVVSG